MLEFQPGGFWFRAAVRRNQVILLTASTGPNRAASRRIVSQLGMSGLKYACDFNGYYGGLTRAPLLAVTGAEKAEIEGLLAGIR